MQFICLFVRPFLCVGLFHAVAQKRCILGLWFTAASSTLIGSLVLKVKPTVQRGRMEVAETATKPSSALLRKHLLGGCTIDMPLSTCHQFKQCSSYKMLKLAEPYSKCNVMQLISLHLSVVNDKQIHLKSYVQNNVTNVIETWSTKVYRIRFLFLFSFL